VEAPTPSGGLEVPRAHTGIARRARWLAVQAYRPLRQLPFLHRLLRPVAKRIRRWLWERELRALHDILDNSPLAGRCWLWCGLLLGWAREGRPLLHDGDADFGVLAEDLAILEQTVPVLESAGYLVWRRYYNNDGHLTEIAFRRKDENQCDIMVMEPVGDDKLRYFLYGKVDGQFVQHECHIPRQPLVPFNFLSRTWLKHADHDLELRTIYGDWQVPNTAWSYLEDDLSVVQVEPWAEHRMLQSLNGHR
jgi:hypothetical protein